MRTMVALSLVGLIGIAGAVAQDAPIGLEKAWVRRAPPCRTPSRGPRPMPAAT